jgi:hypothetical protein
MGVSKPGAVVGLLSLLNINESANATAQDRTGPKRHRLKLIPIEFDTSPARKAAHRTQSGASEVEEFGLRRPLGSAHSSEKRSNRGDRLLQLEDIETAFFEDNFFYNSMSFSFDNSLSFSYDLNKPIQQPLPATASSTAENVVDYATKVEATKSVVEQEKPMESKNNTAHQWLLPSIAGIAGSVLLMGVAAKYATNKMADRTGNIQQHSINDNQIV